MIDIRDHGASPLLTDNASAIQAAFDAAGVGGEVFIPPGVFEFKAKLTAKCHISGPGELRYTGNAAAVALVVGNEAYDGSTTSQQRLRLRDFTLTGKIGVETGLLIRGVSRVVVADVKMSGFVDGVGVRLRYTWIDTLRDCIVTSCKYGVMADAQGATSGDQSANGLTIDGGEIAGCEYGVVIGDPERTSNPDPITGTKTSITHVTIEGCTKGAIWLADGMAIDITSCLFERNGYVSGATLPLPYPPCHIRIGVPERTSKPTSITIRDNSFVGAINGDAENKAAAVYLDRASNVRVIGNLFAINGTNWRAVHLAGNVDYVSARENHVQYGVTEITSAGSNSYARMGILPGSGYGFDMGGGGLLLNSRMSYVARFQWQGVTKSEIGSAGSLVIIA